MLVEWERIEILGDHAEERSISIPFPVDVGKIGDQAERENICNSTIYRSSLVIIEGPHSLRNFWKIRSW